MTYYRIARLVGAALLLVILGAGCSVTNSLPAGVTTVKHFPGVTDSYTMLVPTEANTSSGFDTPYGRITNDRSGTLDPIAAGGPFGSGAPFKCSPFM